MSSLKLRSFSSRSSSGGSDSSLVAFGAIRWVMASLGDMFPLVAELCSSFWAILFLWVRDISGGFMPTIEAAGEEFFDESADSQERCGSVGFSSPSWSEDSIWDGREILARGGKTSRSTRKPPSVALGVLFLDRLSDRWEDFFSFLGVFWIGDRHVAMDSPGRSHNFSTGGRILYDARECEAILLVSNSEGFLTMPRGSLVSVDLLLGAGSALEGALGADDEVTACVVALPVAFESVFCEAVVDEGILDAVEDEATTEGAEGLGGLGGLMSEMDLLGGLISEVDLLGGFISEVDLLRGATDEALDAIANAALLPGGFMTEVLERGAFEAAVPCLASTASARGTSPELMRD